MPGLNTIQRFPKTKPSTQPPACNNRDGNGTSNADERAIIHLSQLHGVTAQPPSSNYLEEPEEELHDKMSNLQVSVDDSVSQSPTPETDLEVTLEVTKDEGQLQSHEMPKPEQFTLLDICHLNSESEMIWAEALKLPQVIVMGLVEGVSFSQTNVTASSCKEAYETLLELKLDFFDNSLSNNIKRSNGSSRPLYFNWEVDIIVYISNNWDLYPDFGFLWSCGRCKNQRRDLGDSKAPCEHEPHILQVAITWRILRTELIDSSKERLDQQTPSWFTLLRRFQPKNLAVLLYGDADERSSGRVLGIWDLAKTVKRKRQVVLFGPSEALETKYQAQLIDGWDWSLGTCSSWKDAEEKVKARLWEFKKEMEKMREEFEQTNAFGNDFADSGDEVGRIFLAWESRTPPESIQFMLAQNKKDD
ncbi:hypothetical protein HYALB_00004989 [Hymenoscyphus albidus]|uniref:Uncharacterized protein n=1 Tax=Hymenoscyphus albidus TaxID=595503 RepID=A0A9N9LXZ7_9HELO|nr:hypothetical protein HYALB_00004989 [Hymenoscyphus albidus]